LESSSTITWELVWPITWTMRQHASLRGHSTTRKVGASHMRSLSNKWRTHMSWCRNYM
jgi:hypothetical protein